MEPSVLKINVVEGKGQIIGQGWKTVPHWVRSDNIQVVIPTNEANTLSALVLSSNVGKVAEILVAEPAESLANRWINGIMEPPPVSQVQTLSTPRGKDLII